MLSHSVRFRRGLALTVLAVTLGGCTLPGGTRTPGEPRIPVAQGSGTPAPTTPNPSASAPTIGTTEPGQPSGQASTAETPLGPTPTGASPTSASPGAPASGSAITVAAGSVRNLAVEDASQSSQWIQEPAQPAGTSGWIYTLGTTVACQATSSPLEFRFANTTGTLNLSLAQSTRSPSTTETITWTVVTDGRTTQTGTVGFGGASEVAIPLSAVSSVQLILSLPSPCQGSATALITRAVVNG